MKIKKMLFIFINLCFFSILFLTSSFFGQSFKSIGIYTRLMDLDNSYKISQNLSTEYIHTDVLFSKETLDSSDLNYLLQKQKTSFMFAERYFVNFVIATEDDVNNSVFLGTNFKSENNNVDFSHEFTYVTQHTFSDSSMLETIPLLLYKDLGSNFRGLYGADFGAYLPSSVADLLIEKQLFDDYEDILNSEITFEIFVENKRVIFSINNIYINNETDQIDREIFNNYKDKYYNYHKHFSLWAHDAIISPCKTPFEFKRPSLKVDVVRNYGNFVEALNLIFGPTYSDEGFSLLFNIYDTKTNNYIKTDAYDLNYFYSSTYKEQHLISALLFFLIVMMSSLMVVVNFFFLKKRIINFNFLFFLYIIFLILFEIIKIILFNVYGRIFELLKLFNYVSTITIVFVFILLLLIPLFFGIKPNALFVNPTQRKEDFYEIII